MLELTFYFRRWALLCWGGVSLVVAHDSAKAAPPVARTAGEVLLVVNQRSSVSRAVGDDYAAKRKITHVLKINCADSAKSTEQETVSMAVYQKEIEQPVRSYLASHPELQFVVLTKGVPIRIVGAETGVRADDSPSTTPLNASVDSTLAALGYDQQPGARKMQITGSGGTGYGWVNRYWNTHEPFSHQKFGGYLVTRLDGYDATDAKRLVARALQSTGHPLAGKVLLDAQPDFGLGEQSTVPAPLPEGPIREESPYAEWNADLLRAGELLQQRKVPVELDMRSEFVGRRHDLAGYYSWGSNDAKFSPVAYRSLRFAAGSLGDTAVSTSARTFLRTEGGQSLLMDLIAAGLTCAKGYTDEPLLQAISSPTITLEHYTAGYTMAESFYAGSHFVGWQDVVIGDPLCAPYVAAP